ncbi:hypothetical protein NDU88_004422 [Pleurodeles waltl]|uniref:Uncharacterized protein n=1 Tax=Pleurodeles waltl TaxID=8319 RepID=A0AAV7RIR0_PLEWA|nr:hypothetical protein NDU88_004422 [Pleurodeles waltl]
MTRNLSLPYDCRFDLVSRSDEQQSEWKLTLAQLSPAPARWILTRSSLVQCIGPNFRNVRPGKQPDRTLSELQIGTAGPLQSASFRKDKRRTNGSFDRAEKRRRTLVVGTH